MKKIIKIIAASICLATTTFAMEKDSYPETLESETQRIVLQTINALEILQPNSFLELAQEHIDDPETSAQCIALFNTFSRFKEDFLPSIIENLQALRTKFDSSSLRDIENGGIPLLYVTELEMQKFLNSNNSTQDESDEDEKLLEQRGRTRTATNNDLLELADSDDEKDSSLAASTAQSDDKSELPSDIL